LEQHRRKGIATRLIKYAESYYSDKNIGGFQLFTGGENISAQRFYEHLSYSRTDEIMYRKRMCLVEDNDIKTNQLA
jgi:ribosomal protein S18 acetylase RimI-like enzyme